MTEQDARVTLLEALQERLEEWRSISHDTHVAKGGVLQLTGDDFDQLATVLGWSPPETWALYKRLVRGGYVRQVRDAREFVEIGGRPQYAWVEDLTDRGYKAIGALHDPADALAEALQAAMQDVASSEDIPEEKKPDVVKALDRVLTVARLVEGAAQIISRHLPPTG